MQLLKSSCTSTVSIHNNDCITRKLCIKVHTTTLFLNKTKILKWSNTTSYLSIIYHLFLVKAITWTVISLYFFKTDQTRRHVYLIIDVKFCMVFFSPLGLSLFILHPCTLNISSLPIALTVICVNDAWIITTHLHRFSFSGHTCTSLDGISTW